MVILLYHRIAEPPTDPQLLCVSPARFAEHLAAVRRLACTVGLLDGLEAVRRGNAHAPTVAITFDDGYADNLENALPCLRAFESPATVFVTARDETDDHEFWWDAIDALLLQGGTLPTTVRIDAKGEQIGWTFPATACDETNTYPGWSVLDPPPTPRHAAYLELCRIIRPMPQAVREVVLGELYRQCGRPRKARPTHRTMTSAQLREISASSLVELGAHTVSHPVLAAIDDHAQQREIQESRARLETRLDRPVRVFSYPFGTRADYTARTVQWVREAGFACACSNFPGRVSKDTDPFQLPRHLVRNWSGAEFEARLQEWLHA